MRSTLPISALLCITACGGGGGGVDTTPPVTAAARLEVAPIEIGPAAQSADLTITLADTTSPPPALLEVAFELPPQLTLPAQDRLTQATPMVTLDGDFVDNRFVVMCGDAQNENAAALPRGPLFRLRVQPTSPRQPGSYTVTLRNVRAAAANGDVITANGDPIAVTVTVR